MQEIEKFAPPGCGISTREAVRAIANRLIGHEDDVARVIATRFRQEIVDYGAGGDALSADAAALARDNLEDFVTNLADREHASTAQLERIRLAAARRVHQGVSLEAFLHAARIWGRCTWEATRAVVGDSPAERDAALDVASRLMHHVDVISTVGTNAWLREAQGLADDGQLLPWDLLEALLGQEPDVDRARREAHMVGVRLAKSYVALSIRGRRPLGRWMVEAARRGLRPANGSLLLGVRDAEVVALYPVSEPAELQVAKGQAHALASAMSDVNVGVSGWHPGLGGIAVAYAEAREAAHIAAAAGVTGRAVSLDDVLIDHIARSTPHVGRILDETLHPLIEYDLRHRTALLDTVRAYVETGFSLRRSAEVLYVHPNTVMYRLRRVHELSGRDPHDPDDLLMLFLAMKLADLSPERNATT